MKAAEMEVPAGQGGHRGEADEGVVEMKATAPRAVTPPAAPAEAAVDAFLAGLGGLVVLCHLGKQGMKGFTIDASDPAARAKGVELVASSNRKGEQIYFGVNAPTERIFKKATKDEIGAARFAHVEIDPDAFMEAKGGYDAARVYLHESVAEELASSPTPPTVIWSSGNGISALWRLSEATDHATLELLNRRLIARWGGDEGTYNVDRILRLVGTVNHPTKKKIAKGYPKVARLATVLHANPSANYTVEALSDGLPEVAAEEPPTAPGANAGVAEDATPLDEGEQAVLMERLAQLRESDPFIRARWEGRGVGLSDDSRSGIDMSLGAMLKARGLSYREMRHTLRVCPAGAGAEKAAEGDERYFERIWTRTGFAAVSVKEVREILVRLVLDAHDRDETLSTEAWASVLFDAHLDANGREEVLTFLSEKMNLGKKRAINQSWKEYFAARSESYKAARAKDQLAIVSEGRPEILWNPLDYNGMLPKIEASLVEDGLMRIDRAYVRVAEDVLPGSDHPDNAGRPEHERQPVPKQILFVPHTKVSMLLAIEKSVCLYKRGEKGTVIPIEVPFDKLPPFMLDLPEKRAPRVTGLVQHPIIAKDGRLISTEGLDAATGIYVALGGWKFPEVNGAPTKDDAVASARRIRELLLAETMLKDDKIDGAAAIAALLTGISRKAMSQGPAVLINATVQGTGKTTLARMMHVVLTGREMAVQTLPEDQGEAGKQILSTLIRSPAMVCFDNLDDGSTIKGQVLAKIITSPTFGQRILGMSQDVEVPTCSLLVFTGNSIGVASDLIRRFVKIDLLAKEARPEQHRYRNADPVGYAQRVRAEVVLALLTIQRAWFAAGANEEGPSLGLGSDVDRLVTWPLAFAGEEGIFEKRDEVAQTSPEEKAKVSALDALAKVFPDATEFTAVEVVRKMNGGSEFVPADTHEAALRNAIEEMDRRRVHSAPVLGLFLRTLVDQPLKGLDIIVRSRIVRGSTLYRVETFEPP
jgi:hypothetical protein